MAIQVGDTPLESVGLVPAPVETPTDGLYESYYGLDRKPFSLAPDPRFLFMSNRHKSAFTTLEYALATGTGIAVITGEVGSGKTTLIRHLIEQIDERYAVGLITNTRPRFEQLLKWVSMAFGLDYRGKDEVELYDDFIKFAIDQYAKGLRTLLIIDEAQNMGFNELEELRTLSNINSGGDMILQLVLVGQPELRDKLVRTELRQFAQRIAAEYHLGPLEPNETRDYIRHRLRVAGGKEKLFDTMACASVHHFSKGVPRLINILCDTALVYGFAAERRTIDMSTIFEVVEDKKGGVLDRFLAASSLPDRQPKQAESGKSIE